ncbi:hypothetical protein SAVIM40S_05575 [Streptomyces avidinii]
MRRTVALSIVGSPPGDRHAGGIRIRPLLGLMGTMSSPGAGRARQNRDFLGWVDPGAPLRAHLVLPREDGPLGISLRVPSVGRTSVVKSSLCQICLTGHASSGVTLLAAPLAGARGREGNTVGTYICADLACPLYVRGKRQPKLRAGRYEESLTLDERLARMSENLDAFVARVTGT